MRRLKRTFTGKKIQVKQEEPVWNQANEETNPLYKQGIRGENSLFEGVYKNYPIKISVTIGKTIQQIITEIVNELQLTSPVEIYSLGNALNPGRSLDSYICVSGSELEVRLTTEVNGSIRADIVHD
eukprot:TRINITY_DN6314_c0_g1_i1.p2 TRINITY_DN6314_c0_g1~~TRINITY_DN6314_c0_g1_i1.p2  ORF type:complete len:126 (-),score=24.31 TRINITY_DN6314_c0_g1_i1:657-1034(-)